MAKAKKVNLQDEVQREKVFLQIIKILQRYNDAERKHIAQEAGISWQCIYNWIAYKTVNPQLRTLAPVARTLGYELVLKRQTPAPPKLRRIK